MYGDTNLGATDEAVIMFLKTPMNKPIFDALKAHVYPEFAAHLASKEPYVEPVTTVEEPPINPPKTTGRPKKS